MKMDKCDLHRPQTLSNDPRGFGKDILVLKRPDFEVKKHDSFKEVHFPLLMKHGNGQLLFEDVLPSGYLT
jgi:hypothetical protein